MNKNTIFSPGPSAMYFTVEDHVKQAFREQIPSISHRSKAFEAIFSQAVDNLKELLSIPEDYQVFFLASATEAWERIIQNAVLHESFHLVHGAFSRRFYDIAVELGRQPQKLESPEGTCPDIQQVVLPKTCELIGITQNETSTGAAFPLEDIYQLRRSFPNSIIATDVVSAAPYIPMDYAKVDTAFFSVQKCFGLPAGLGVWVTGPRFIEKAAAIREAGNSTGSYHSLASLEKYAKKNQTPETPNVLAIYLLGKVAGDMLRVGIDQIRKDTAYKAAVLYHALDESNLFSPFVCEEHHRSKTVIVAETKVPADKVTAALAQSGMVLGKGYGSFKNDHIRIANFPAHSKEQIELLADKLSRLEF